MTRRQRKYISLTLSVLMVAVLVAVAAVTCGHRRHKTVARLADLRGAIVGVQLGTTADTRVTPMESDGSGTHVERYTKTADAVQALLQGKVDAVVVDEQPARAFRSQSPQLVILPEPFATERYALCMARGRDGLLRRADAAIAALRAEGVLDTIAARHLRGDATVAYRPQSRHSGTLVVATNATFRPYEYYADGEVVGIDIDIARAVADRLGMDVRVEDMEFDAVVASVQTGKADLGAAALTVTPERRRNVAFTAPYASTRIVVLVRGAEAQAAGGQTLADRFRANFLTDGRYLYLLGGLGNTLLITLLAMIISLVVGTLVAIVRTTHDARGTLALPDALCRAYLMVIRGTPTMVQLLVIYYVVFATADVSKVFVAVVAFGINSSAYLAEVVRSGIMAVDRGQAEAGRSLGLSYAATLRRIILPQAFRNVLPAVGNELITLLKETSICGYIGLVDLTKGSDIIRSITYDAMMPLGLVAVIYFTLVAALAYGVGRLEKHLARHDR